MASINDILKFLQETGRARRGVTLISDGEWITAVWPSGKKASTALKGSIQAIVERLGL